jgi:hypothetical protein
MQSLSKTYKPKARLKGQHIRATTSAAFNKNQSKGSLAKPTPIQATSLQQLIAGTMNFLSPALAAQGAQHKPARLLRSRSLIARTSGVPGNQAPSFVFFHDAPKDVPIKFWVAFCIELKIKQCIWIKLRTELQWMSYRIKGWK